MFSRLKRNHKPFVKNAIQVYSQWLSISMCGLSALCHRLDTVGPTWPTLWLLNCGRDDADVCLVWQLQVPQTHHLSEHDESNVAETMLHELFQQVSKQILKKTHWKFTKSPLHAQAGQTSSIENGPEIKWGYQVSAWIEWRQFQPMTIQIRT